MNKILQGVVELLTTKKERFIAKSVNEFLIGEYLLKVTSKNVVVSCTLCAWPPPVEDEESALDNHVIACNCAKYSPILILFH